MKKILFSAAILAVCFGGAMAQQVQTTQTQQQASRVNQQRQNFQKRTPDQIAQMKTDRLDKMVQLSADQKAKVKNIYLKDAQVNQGKMAQRKEVQEQINSVLTADQATKLKTQQQARMAKMKARKGNWRGQQQQGDQNQN